MSDIRPAPGVLLIAPPIMLDPNFRRTVVLLCEHSEEGSFGLILNRPLTLELGELIKDFYSDERVSLGGPVQQNTLHFLHRYGDLFPHSIAVLEGVHWGGDFETVKELIRNQQVSPGDLRFFLGYAGWSPGQLDAEIDQGGWILHYGQGGLIFEENPDRLWRTVMRRMGGEYALLANYPDDPRLN